MILRSVKQTQLSNEISAHQQPDTRPLVAKRGERAFLMTPATRALPRHLMGTDRMLNVVLVGAEGKGSEFFGGVIHLHQGFIALGAPGINVMVYDDDTVSESNIVRQQFWPHEIGLPTADALVRAI